MEQFIVFHTVFIVIVQISKVLHPPLLRTRTLCTIRKNGVPVFAVFVVFLAFAGVDDGRVVTFVGES